MHATAPRLPLVLLLAALLPACRIGAPASSARPLEAGAPRTAPAPDDVQPDWKERLAETYVYVEHSGDYRQVGDTLRELFAEARSAGLRPSGPPFALFYDDPGVVPRDRLRARACLPVAPGTATPAGLRADRLPQAMVAYGRVAGAYDQVPRSYPRLFEYLREKAWAANGPIREIYLVDPGQVESLEALVTEVQIPWTVR